MLLESLTWFFVCPSFTLCVGGGGRNSCSGLVAVDCSGDDSDGDTHIMQLGEADGSLIVGLAEILSGRLPIFTLRTRCQTQAYCLSADDIRRIFADLSSASGSTSAAGSGMLMRLVAQATAVHMRRQMLYLVAQWERFVHRISAASAVAVIPGSSEAMAAAARSQETAGGRVTRPNHTRMRAAVGQLFENGLWSPRQEEEAGR
jgi:hypothetical protein